jgi:hypothetical protein
VHLLLRLLEILGVLLVLGAAVICVSCCVVSGWCSRDEERFAAAEAAGDAELIAALDKVTGFGSLDCTCESDVLGRCVVPGHLGFTRSGVVGGSAHDRRKARRAAARVGKVRAA